MNDDDYPCVIVSRFYWKLKSIPETESSNGQGSFNSHTCTCLRNAATANTRVAQYDADRHEDAM